MEREFIRNTLNVDVDALRCVNHYQVVSIYDVEQADGFWKYEHEIIEDLSLTWQEIDEMGGIEEIVKEFKEEYNIGI